MKNFFRAVANFIKAHTIIIATTGLTAVVVAAAAGVFAYHNNISPSPAGLALAAGSRGFQNQIITGVTLSSPARIVGTNNMYSPLTSRQSSEVALTDEEENTAFTLTIDPNGGTWVYDGVEYASEHTFDLTTGAEIIISAPTNPKYEFKGWLLSNNSCTLSGTTYTQGEGDCSIIAVWEKTGLPLSPVFGYCRLITLEHLETLDSDSKWHSEDLMALLMSILSEDLTAAATHNHEGYQVWKFSADDYDNIHKWCLDNNKKSAETNQEFLNLFGNHREQ